MNPVLDNISIYPQNFCLFGYPFSEVYLTMEIFEEYHLKKFGCHIVGDFLDITSFVVKDKGCGYGGRLLDDLDEWAKSRGLRLCLTPQPYEETSKKAYRRLAAFYRRKGFIEAPEGEWCPEAMYRP